MRVQVTSRAIIPNIDAFRAPRSGHGHGHDGGSGQVVQFHRVVLGRVSRGCGGNRRVQWQVESALGLYR